MHLVSVGIRRYLKRNGRRKGESAEERRGGKAGEDEREEGRVIRVARWPCGWPTRSSFCYDPEIRPRENHVHPRRCIARRRHPRAILSETVAVPRRDTTVDPSRAPTRRVSKVEVVEAVVQVGVPMREGTMARSR